MLIGEVRIAIKDFLKLMTDVVNEAEGVGEGVIHAFHEDTVYIKQITDNIETDMEIVGTSIGKELEVVFNKAVGIPKTFVKDTERAVVSAEHRLTKTGETAVEGLESITASIKKKLENEHAAMDILMIFVIGTMLITIIAVFTATRSLLVVLLIVTVLFVAFGLYLLT